MKTAHTVHHSRLSTITFFQKAVLLLFLAISVSACANKTNVKYLGLERETIDTERGFSGSEARIEVTQRVSIEASSMIDEDTGMLLTEVTIANASQRDMRLLYRGCPVQIQVFDNEDREGEPLFDSFTGISDWDCPRREVVRTLFIQEDLSLMEHTDMSSAFADSNPMGKYYVTAIVRPNGIPMEVPAGAVEVGSELGSWQAYEGF